MWTTIHLLNCKDINREHTPSFLTRDEQLQYFLTKKIKTIENNQYTRENQILKVKGHIDDLLTINYLCLNNNRKWYYYFILNKFYINEGTSGLIIKLDVIQTYLFDFVFRDSLVERMHYDRTNKNGTINKTYFKNEETLDTGEYENKAKIEVYDYKNKGGYIIASGDRMGVINGGNSGNTNPTGNISENIFVFLKGYEAFASTPYNAGDGTRTIGYGLTEAYQPEYFNKLLPTCTEKQASEVLYEVMFNNFFTPLWEEIKAKRKNPNQNEVDAFLSLSYNAGLYGCTSSPMFQKYINNEPITECAIGWGEYYINSGTIFEEGLRDRREKEKNIFLNNKYVFKPIAIYGGGIVSDNNGKGYIPEAIRNTNTDENTRLSIVNSARKLIGKPYVWGGNVAPLGNDNGTDCSGLCQWAFNDNGKKISRTTYTQINEGQEVSLQDLKIADLVFSNFSSPNVPEHVFLVSRIEDGRYYCVEAQTDGTNILEREFTPMSSYRYRNLI